MCTVCKGWSSVDSETAQAFRPNDIKEPDFNRGRFDNERVSRVGWVFVLSVNDRLITVTSELSDLFLSCKPPQCFRW